MTDIDGDEAVDLVVSAPGNPNGTDVFGAGSQPYWKVYRGVE